MHILQTIFRYSSIVLGVIILLYLLHMTWGLVIPSAVVGIGFYGTLIFLVIRAIVKKIQPLGK